MGIKAWPLALMTAAALFIYAPPKTNAEQFNLNLFPKSPIERGIMADQDIFKTGINLNNPQKSMINTPIKNIPLEFYIGESVPIISLAAASPFPNQKTRDSSTFLPPGYHPSNKILASIVTIGGQTYFQKSGFINYKAKAEMLFNSPELDSIANGENHLYFGIEWIGGNSAKLEKLANESPKNIITATTKDQSLLLDLYFIPRGYANKQSIITRAGITYNPKSKAESYHISLSGEIPTKSGDEPYFSMAFSGIGSGKTKFLTEAGINFKNKYFFYIGTDSTKKDFLIQTGIKLK